jgi:hypothetical protein
MQLEVRRRIYHFPGSGDRSAARGRLGNAMRRLLTGEERRKARVHGPASSALARRLAAEIIRPAAVSSDRDPKLPPLGCEGCELEIIAALASPAMQRRSVAAGC